MTINEGNEIGHGCFLLSDGGNSYSHSHRENNKFQTVFKYETGDIIKIDTNVDELLFSNETRKWEWKVKVRLTEEEWQQACFCVLLYGKGDSVLILDPDDKSPYKEITSDKKAANGK